MAVNSAGNAFLEVLSRWLGSNVTGAIEWQDGKRRRIVFLEAGQITMVQSNLKSESVERLVEQGVAADLIAATRQTRLLGLLAERDGAVLGHPASEPATREPVPVALALWEVAHGLPAVPMDAFPRAVPGAGSRLGGVPWAPALTAYLTALDGSRSTDDVIDFAPENPSVVSSALAVAHAVGAIETNSDPAVLPKILGQGGRGDRPSGFFQASAERTEEQFDPDEATDLIDDARIVAAQNHFEVLGVEWQDPPETMRRAYVSLAARLHPDQWGQASPEAKAKTEQLFEIVRGAWEVLSDPKKRDAYTRRVIMGELSDEEKADAQLQAVFEAERLLTLAQLDIARQRFPQAHELLKQALAADPLHTQVRAYAAYCVIRLNPGKTSPAVDEAVRELEEVAARTGTDWARLLVARMRQARGDLDGAQQAFIQTLKINPSNPDALAELKRLRGMRAEKENAAKGFFAKLFGR